MKISDALASISWLYVDTAPFIYYLENRSIYGSKMRTIFEHVHNRQIRITTSPVTITETLIKPLQLQNFQLADQYRALFYKTMGLALQPINPKTGDLAAQLRAKHGLKTPDALHVAAAIEAECNAFLTNDIGIKRVDEITILILDELEYDDN